MSQSPIVYRSAVASLLVQVLVGAVTGAGLFVDLPEDVAPDLRVIFALELSSQVIELLWYLIVVCTTREIRTWTRYIDWVFSTPVMLISTALFFHHRRSLPLGDVFEAPLLYVSLGLNESMLLFGFLLERGTVAPLPGLALGGAAFVGSFAALSTLMDPHDGLSVGLFVAMYAVWGLYGVAAAMADVPKNVAYNVLDIFSKNFYGLFLFIYSLTLL